MLWRIEANANNAIKQLRGVRGVRVRHDGDAHSHLTPHYQEYEADLSQLNRVKFIRSLAADSCLKLFFLAADSIFLFGIFVQ